MLMHTQHFLYTIEGALSRPFSLSPIFTLTTSPEVTIRSQRLSEVTICHHWSPEEGKGKDWGYISIEQCRSSLMWLLFDDALSGAPATQCYRLYQSLRECLAKYITLKADNPWLWSMGQSHWPHWDTLGHIGPQC